MNFSENSKLKKTLRSSRGQGLVEYLALTALIAIVCVGTVKTFGNRVKTRLTQVSNTFDRNIQQGLRPQSTRSSDSRPENMPAKMPSDLPTDDGGENVISRISDIWSKVSDAAKIFN